VWPFAQRPHTNLGIRSTTRLRGICWRRGLRVHVGCSERGGGCICRNHLLWAEESIRDFVIFDNGVITPNPMQVVGSIR